MLQLPNLPDVKGKENPLNFTNSNASFAGWHKLAGAKEGEEGSKNRM